jgi:hypothetical protein
MLAAAAQTMKMIALALTKKGAADESQGLAL